MKIKKIINIILPARSWKIFAIITAGIICGLGAYVAYSLRVVSYIADKPSACVNCHIMAPYYATWAHSSHGRNTTCNDCHVPHDNVARKWFFKLTDGMRHVAVFTLRNEPQVIRAREESQEVILENCIRCHTQLNSEFVKTGTMTQKMIAANEGKACWDCHRDVPHGTDNQIGSTPNAIIPYPETKVPEWLDSQLKSKEYQNNK